MLTMSRAPTKSELAATVEFLQHQGSPNTRARQKQRLAELCHVLFMSNEFFYID